MAVDVVDAPAPAAFADAPAVQTPVPSAPLIDGGQLSASYRGLAARLQRVFPPAKFAHEILPGRLTPADWDKLTERTPMVALGWAGMSPVNVGQRTWRGYAEWTVLLVAQNERQDELLLGNILGAGLFGMVQVAAVALHGHSIPGIGAIHVQKGSPAYAEDWGKADLAVAALSAVVQFDLVDSAAMEALDDFLRNGMRWAGLPDLGAPVFNQRDN